MAKDSRVGLGSVSQPITVKIVRELAGGVIVSLPDGSEGFIRERELPWSVGEKRKGAKEFKPGESIQAVILNKKTNGLPELSIRLVQADTWIDFEIRYPVGSLAEGIVTGIMPYGVLVELELGITALLHRSRLPVWAEAAPGDLFWPGDLVKVIIEKVDARNQRISLSMDKLLSHRWRNMAPRDRRQDGTPAPSKVEEPLRSRLDVLFACAPKSVLVVEDDLTDQEAIANWLRRAGQLAEVASTVEEATQLMDSLRPDIVLMNLGLPAGSGIDGMRRIKARWPETRCSLMTDLGYADLYAPDIQEMREAGVSLQIKPLLPEDLVDILLEQPDSSAVAQSQLPLTPAILAQATKQFSGVKHEALVGMLAHLLSATHADKVVLFEVDTDSRQVAIFDQRGPAALRASTIPELIHSPVRDVAEDGQVIVARNSQEAERGRFHSLASFINFSMCVGVPVPARIRKRYALFLFYFQPSPRLEGNISQAEGTAAIIGSWLERQQSLKQMANLHRVAVLGQMKRALGHEISGKLAPINLVLEELEEGYARIQRNATSSPEQVIEEATLGLEKIKTLKQQAKMIARTTRSLSRMTQVRQDDIVILDQLIGDSLDILHDLANTGNVTIEAQRSAHVTFTRTNVTYLQQVLVNVLQNAIQHIQQLRPNSGGRVVIQIDLAEQREKRMLELRITDDGPGIHRRNWERIFDLDFTTRLEGSGLGLHLSRNLVETQGGSLRVESSHILWGTTFLIELPLHT